MSDESFTKRIRNGALATAVATSSMLGLAGCDQPGNNKAAPRFNQNAPAYVPPAAGGGAAPAPANDVQNLFNVLAQHQFVGQDGQPVNVAALSTSLRDSYNTLTFGFAECQNYCPMINNVLGQLGQSNPRLNSIVVAANPQGDGATQASRDAFMQRLRNDGIRHNVTILYPTENGKLSNNTVPKIAMSTGAIVNATKPLDHSAKVVLYAPGGNRVADKSGLRSGTEFVNEWAPIMGNGQIR
jgi:cytochrome oxidase Cu insertion factor (SCO1/SenC/PrrC family)